MLRTAAALALASTLLASGCSGDDDGTAARETGPAVDTASSTDEPEPRREWQLAIQPGPQRRAESVVVTASDLPPGWRQRDRGVGVVSACIGGDFSAFTLTGALGGKVFQRDDEGRVLSAAQVYDTEQAAADGFALLAAELGKGSVERCVDELTSQTPDAPEVGVAIRELPVQPRPAVDEAKAWLATVSYPEEPYVAYEQTVILRNGDTIAFLMTWGVLRPFNPVLEDRLIATVAGRIADSG
jgi:hypothetical protein